MEVGPLSERIPVQGVSGTCQRLGGVGVVLTLVEMVGPKRGWGAWSDQRPMVTEWSRTE